MKLRPIGDRVLIRLLPAEESHGAIVIPDTAKEKPTQGIVEAVGEGRAGEGGARIPMQVKKGDRVLFGRYAGTEVRLYESEHMVVHESEILAVL